jgi:hypothetical protein
MRAAALADEDIVRQQMRLSNGRDCLKMALTGSRSIYSI